MSTKISSFSYTEQRTLQSGKQTEHRIWMGEYIDPDNTIGVIVGSTVGGKWSSNDIAIPTRAIPHLVRYLQQFVTEGGDE